MNFTKRLSPIILGAALTLTSACGANADEFSKEEIEQIVHEYILENPEIIEEAIYRLQARAEQQRAADAASKLTDMAELIFNNDIDPVGGNPNGDITLVEFFDYNCGYCKRAQATLKALIKSNPDLRVVYKEWPILSEASAVAARIALAVNLTTPDKYQQFHFELMSGGSVRSADDVWKVVAKVGLDRSAIEAKMKHEDVELHLQQTSALASELGITGTPAFLVGDAILKGAYPQADIQRAIDEARL